MLSLMVVVVGMMKMFSDDDDFKKLLIPVELNRISYVLYFTGKEMEI